MTPQETSPKRIQRKRTKGWRMPLGTTYVGRPSAWGNPYSVGDACGCADQPDVMDAESAVLHFREDTVRNAESGWFSPLRGRDLACWCPLGQPCHADVLLELANR